MSDNRQKRIAELEAELATLKADRPVRPAPTTGITMLILPTPSPEEICPGCDPKGRGPRCGFCATADKIFDGMEWDS